MPMRLDKFIVAVGAGSRSQAKTMVKSKRLTVNGQVVQKSSMKIDELVDQVHLDGQKLSYHQFDYIMLNKPSGFISATKDPYEKTVLDLLPNRYHRVWPVGRLDKDTVGLLLLTNDGQLSHQLLSPKKHVDKTYEVRLASPCQFEDISAMAEGIRLDDGYRCLPARLELLSEDGRTVTLTIQEGKFHQVKRMFLARGNQVTHLKRLSMGTIILDEKLKEGDYRLLTDEERNSLLFCNQSD